MQRTTDGFSVELEVLEGDTLELCFKDSANNWDNNSGNNYSFKISTKKKKGTVAEKAVKEKTEKVKKTTAQVTEKKKKESKVKDSKSKESKSKESKSKALKSKEAITNE